MQKKEIRRTALAERMALSEQEFKRRNNKLLSHFSGLDFSKISAIHIFLPILKQREPNTFLLIEWLEFHKQNIKIIVPKADFKTALMSHHEYMGRANLNKNLFDILEPDSSTAFEGEIDMVFVPLLAFDKQGQRVGYGKGFYDRFLQNTTAKKIGLSLNDLPVEISNLHSDDVALNACITPKRIINFS